MRVRSNRGRVMSKSHHRLRLKASLATACLLALASGSFASPATSIFVAQRTVVARCTINSAATLNFGAQGGLIANLDRSSTVQVQCTDGTPYNIGLDAGIGPGATVAVRKMTSGGAGVNYSLY